MNIEKRVFGQTPDGRSVDVYTLTNDNGMSCAITNFGGIILTLKVPDREAALDDVVLGHDTLEPYCDVNTNPYFGALIGRYGNRIAKGRFRLNGVDYTLALNDGDHHLHGGLKGFDKALWSANERTVDRAVELELEYLSNDGEEGYPGNLRVTVVYSLTRENALQLDYHAVSDRDTVLNLTNHSYFNLAGARSGSDILDHQLMLSADRFTPSDGGLIPTGEYREVAGSPMDFRVATRIGARIHEQDEQLLRAGGYDHNWVLNSCDGSLALAAQVYEPVSGRVMDLFTTAPGVQFYTGNFLDGSITGKGSTVYRKHSGFCLETQHFPNSPNQPEFPSTVLKAGEEYTQTSLYVFSTR
ncbi:galactose-1-epimerase [candidate division KSB3 bacterium]|uniref:Aldose 1-epimerase n=1 Tax=candidate division KSB3 bacterium TaxID=2044937 RepID=A0A2G6EAD9_9BACT|nr:MAG: galactose-1-epimerase [candidate division KSB3 bacterium]PIE30873.1 MAG: galactose-1-epimerase [candidate division KSB3 bacterium]